MVMNVVFHFSPSWVWIRLYALQKYNFANYTIPLLHYYYCTASVATGTSFPTYLLHINCILLAKSQLIHHFALPSFCLLLRCCLFCNLLSCCLTSSFRCTVKASCFCFHVDSAPIANRVGTLLTVSTLSFGTIIIGGQTWRPSYFGSDGLGHSR